MLKFHKPLQWPMIFEERQGACRHCQLESQACICKFLPAIESDMFIFVLFHRNELNKPSSTGKILCRSVNTCTSSVWQRKEKIFNKDCDQVKEDLILLLPDSIANRYQGSIAQSHETVCVTEAKGKSFLLLDGTWQEVRKMYRQSEVLQSLKIFKFSNISNIVKEDFPLRRNQIDSGCSTIEAAMLLMREFNKYEQLNELKKIYLRFCNHVLASRNHTSPYT